jgi:signal transduction histidine kinase
MTDPQRIQPLVLVVEDDPGMNSYICDALSPEFATVAAADGYEALSLASQHLPDVIVADIMMPRMSGDELLRHVRKTPALGDTPVLLLTGKNDDDLRAKLLREGAQDYLLKPFSPLELRARTHNIVAQRQAERIRAANAVLSEEVRVKSVFLRTLSHELRSPLNGIIGLTEIVHDGRAGPLSSEQKEYLGDVLGSARHLLRLVTNVLDLVSIEAGKIDQKPEPLDIKAAVKQVERGLAALAVAKGIRIHTIIDAGLNRLVVDRARIQQIVFNYLSNALKFTPDGGRVTVRVVPEDADYFRIEVQDTGPGIREEDLGRLFTEFQQLHVSVAAQAEGAALGLALTKRIVEALGGTVGVRSTPGIGSVFHAILPRAPVNPQI